MGHITRLPNGLWATGPVGPIGFLRNLHDAEVVLWEKKEEKHADGSKTITYSPRPTPGAHVLRPGNHPIFKGIHSGRLTDRLEFLSLMLALFGGTAALPHILIRYYTVKDSSAARKSTVVGIGVIGAFYLLTLLLGLGAMTSGALDVSDENMSAPLLAKSFGNLLFAIISAIAFTTVLGTVSGLIVAASGAVVHDLVPIFVRNPLTDHEKVRLGKLAAVGVGVLGIVFQGMNVGFLVGWAFSVAASANLPALVMLLFWKRTTRQGISVAILVGMISSLAWILLSGDTYAKVYGLPKEQAIVPFSQPGIVTIPLGFLVLIVVSLLTRADYSPCPGGDGRWDAKQNLRTSLRPDFRQRDQFFIDGPGHQKSCAEARSARATLEATPICRNRPGVFYITTPERRVRRLGCRRFATLRKRTSEVSTNIAPTSPRLLQLFR